MTFQRAFNSHSRPLGSQSLSHLTLIAFFLGLLIFSWQELASSFLGNLGNIWLAKASALQIEGNSQAVDKLARNAIDIYSTASRLGQRYRIYQTDQGRAYLLLGDRWAGVHWFEKALSESERNERTRLWRYFLGQAFFELGMQEQALDVWAEANLAGRLLLERRAALAVELFQRQAVLNPPECENYRGLGQAFEDSRRWEDAQKAYQHLVALCPRELDGYVRLSRVAFWNLHDLESAERATIAALALVSGAQKFSLYVNLGDFNFLSGKFDVALQWYLKARESDPGRQESHLSINLARTYWGLGMKQQAAKELRRAKEVWPDNSDVEMFLREYQNQP